jgi:hypothetical protein
MTLFSPSVASAQKLAHLRLHKAIYEMEQAIAYLNEAPKVFGGHKQKAIEALEAATKQLKLALEAVGEPYVARKGKEASKGEGPHPRITSAINDLREAETYLEKAPHDFKGHKVKAIKDIRTAISELEAALEFAAKKGK